MISLLIAAATAAAAPSAETVRCSIDDGAAVVCRMTDSVLPDGSHRLEFVGGTKRVVFVGRGESGWWAGTLDGQPAMGYERNRGNTVFATRDLKRHFAWWYPRDEHGTY